MRTILVLVKILFSPSQLSVMLRRCVLRSRIMRRGLSMRKVWSVCKLIHWYLASIYPNKDYLGFPSSQEMQDSATLASRVVARSLTHKITKNFPKFSVSATLLSPIGHVVYCVRLAMDATVSSPQLKCFFLKTAD